MHKLSAYEVTFILNVEAHHASEAVEIAREFIDSGVEPDVVEELDEGSVCIQDDCDAYEDDDDW